jgi:hypothetical protein
MITQSLKSFLCRCLLALVLWPVVNGCTVKFYYNQLDWLIPWRLESYMSLNDDQRRLLEQSLSQQLRWHRDTQLPAYANWLRQLGDDLQDGLEPGELDRHEAVLEGYWQLLLNQFAPDLGRLLALATDAQVADLFANLEENNREYRQEYVALPAAELRRKYAEFATEELKRWLAEVTPEQEQLIARWLEKMEVITPERLQYRQQWQQRLRELLAKRRDRDSFMAAFQQFFQSPERDRPAEYQRKFDHNQAVFKAFALALDERLTAEQRRFLLRRLDALASDFKQLAQAG